MKQLGGKIRALAVLVLLGSASLPVPAATVSWQLRVQDGTGLALSDVVVELTQPGEATGTPRQTAVVQRNKTFVPFVTVVPTGSTVMFPNEDTVRHHVYSFSAAKTFEIPLYHGDSIPVVFDKQGVVVLGCNIHDSMLAYIVVSDAPWQAVTDASGVVKFDLPAGQYRLKLWHPRQQKPLPEQSIEVSRDATVQTISLPVTAAKPVTTMDYSY
ncbi:methylamine utilization protein [Pokkaliibacter sp. MBI-7]|uniref:methylamine utilization protein n=1 Tax=Pokkaliibacter sp. MBI-7 TaxID=3040600 RepID=UPI00244A2FC2|nr:methylamine utilization protein [Pokkaliibacter sp. MBI-7]MDH2433766.1 methylamine utilization protein [Pokkaliibacter sp. MBI-7]